MGWRLPAALESVSASEIRQHLGPFLEHTFSDWALRENQEVQQALTELAQRQSQASSSSASANAEALTGPDSRLMRPSFEVSTFALDASVVAALALGVGTLFANAAVGACSCSPRPRWPRLVASEGIAHCESAPPNRQ